MPSVPGAFLGQTWGCLGMASNRNPSTDPWCDLLLSVCRMEALARILQMDKRHHKDTLQHKLELQGQERALDQETKRKSFLVAKWRGRSHLKEEAQKKEGIRWEKARTTGMANQGFSAGLAKGLLVARHPKGRTSPLPAGSFSHPVRSNKRGHAKARVSGGPLVETEGWAGRELPPWATAAPSIPRGRIPLRSPHSHTEHELLA